MKMGKTAISIALVAMLAAGGQPALSQEILGGGNEPPEASPQEPGPAMKPARKRDTPKERFAGRFKAADTNADGGLSMTELERSKAFPAMHRNFDAIDVNRDGKVTIEEYRAWRRTNAPAGKPDRY